MLKRLKYVSEHARPLAEEDIDAIVATAAKRNAAHGITGFLMSSGGLFLQVIEGPVEAVDALWEEIQGDPRHRNLLVLTMRRDVAHRLFPDWSMRKVDLDHGSTARMEPLRLLLQTAVGLRTQLDGVVGALEKLVWNEFAD
jgi:hypothetical protein